jgi:hypothetical protein
MLDMAREDSQSERKSPKESAVLRCTAKLTALFFEGLLDLIEEVLELLLIECQTLKRQFIGHAR